MHFTPNTSEHLKTPLHWLPETNSRQYLLALKYCSHWTESPFHTRGVLSILILQWIEICQTADSFTFTTAAWTQDSLRFTSSVPPASALFYQTFSLLNLQHLSSERGSISFPASLSDFCLVPATVFAIAAVSQLWNVLCLTIEVSLLGTTLVNHWLPKRLTTVVFLVKLVSKWKASYAIHVFPCLLLCKHKYNAFSLNISGF